MSRFSIGVMVDSFRLPLEGIAKAKEVELLPVYRSMRLQVKWLRKIFQPRRKEILDLIRSHGLVVSALCGDLGGHGLP